MNFVLKPKNQNQYTIYGVRRTADGFVVRSTTVNGNGQVVVSEDIDLLSTLEDANERARKIALTKAERKGRILVENPPEFVRNHFDAEDAEWVTPQQMIDLLEAAKRERYVVFRNVDNLGDRFDLGVQYLAINFDDDDEAADVIDNFGKPCGCLKSRFASVELTEAGKEVKLIERRREHRKAKEQAQQAKKGMKEILQQFKSKTEELYEQENRPTFRI